jgi:hypothetical protein
MPDEIRLPAGWLKIAIEQAQRRVSKMAKWDHSDLISEPQKSQMYDDHGNPKRTTSPFPPTPESDYPNAVEVPVAVMRAFDTGATRSSAEGKPDYSGYLSPLAIEGFGRYMLKHQKQADGQYRSSNNWKKGMPMKAFVQSMWRHFHAFWKFVDYWLDDKRDFPTVFDEDDIDAIREDLYGLMFNVMGFAHEFEKRTGAKK